MIRTRTLVAMFQGKDPIREQGIIGYLTRRFFVLENINYEDGLSILYFLPRKENTTLLRIAIVASKLEKRYPWVSMSIPTFVEVVV